MPVRLRGILLLLLLWPAAQGVADSQPLHPVAGQPVAAAFELQDIDGKRHRLADYKGKVVVLNFWATWCPPCREELPSMEKAHRILQPEGIHILAVNVGEEADTIFTFTSDYPVSFPLLMDRDSRIIRDYPVVGLPTTYIIDPRGRLVYRAIGTRVWDAPDLLGQLRALQSAKP